MAHVVISPGEKVTIGFRDSDGEITVAFNSADLTVTTDFPATTGREVVYQDFFGEEGPATVQQFSWGDIASQLGTEVFDTAMFDPLGTFAPSATKDIEAGNDLELKCEYTGTAEEVTAILRKHPDGWYLIAYIDDDGNTHLTGR